MLKLSLLGLSNCHLAEKQNLQLLLNSYVTCLIICINVNRRVSSGNLSKVIPKIIFEKTVYHNKKFYPLLLGNLLKTRFEGISQSQIWLNFLKVLLWAIYNVMVSFFAHLHITSIQYKAFWAVTFISTSLSIHWRC